MAMISFRQRPSGPGRMLSGSRWDGCGHRLQGDPGPAGRVSAPSRSSGSLVGRNELIGTALVTHATGPGKARARYRTAPVPVALKMVLQIAERNIGQLTDIEPSPPELPVPVPRHASQAYLAEGGRRPSWYRRPRSGARRCSWVGGLRLHDGPDTGHRWRLHGQVSDPGRGAR
jgi:hypothetical protein